MRRRIVATWWPGARDGRRRLTGRAPRHHAGPRPTLGDGLRLERMRGQAEQPAELPDRDRRAGHPLRARPLAARQRAPLIVTHGWPGSIVEQLKIIGPLTDPTSYGGDAASRFHVVIPSLPGHGFSAKPTTMGWDPARIARAWVVLMHRLGYTEFVAQGGDWGRGRDADHGHAGAAGVARASTPTCPAPPPPTSSRASRPANRRHPISRTKSDARTSSCQRVLREATRRTR